MSYEFTEEFGLIIPDVQEQLADFSESTYSKNHGLVIEVAAIHAGATANFNNYSEEELAKAVNTWLEPYPKPIVINHDIKSEPLGRVMGAKMDQEADGTPFTRLQVAVLDPDAIQKVSDGRYLTGSVGGKADEAVCSVCETDWANPKESRGLPCVHRRGKVYSGKIATLQMKGINWKEYSFVNSPADGTSSIRKVGAPAQESDDDWTRPARFFVLDMVSEGIVEHTEADTHSILDGMRKKDALPLYTGLKGAFIIAQTIHEEELSTIKDSANVDNPDTTNDSDPNSEENVMSKEAEAHDDDDILAVAEGISADLSAKADEDKDAEPAEETAAVEGEETPEEGAEAPAEGEENPEAAEEGERRPEGQEKPKDRDVDPETGEGAPKSRESEEETKVEGQAAEAEQPAEETPEEAADETVAEEAKPEDELNPEENVDVESQLAALQARVTELEDQNTKLKAALKQKLVEQVVDTKIALGLVEATERTTEIEEHTGRSAVSLGDTLKDLWKMEPRVKNSSSVQNLEMDESAEVVGNEDNVTTMGDTDIEEAELNPEAKLENLAVDILMGRKKA